MHNVIYLDHNATTPVLPEVLEVMLPLFSEQFANASSHTHFPGRNAAAVIDVSREQVAGLLGCEKGEVIFASGSTEALNIAILGITASYRKKGNHIITWQTEHKAVLEPCKALEKNGYRVSYLPVSREGLPDLDLLESTITNETLMIIMMLANNETGVIMPFGEASAIAHRHGALAVCDATQAAGKIRIDVNGLGADLLSVSSHKMYGPKGAGALFVRRKNPTVTLHPLMYGGGHEKGLRPGTYNVPAIAGMGKAAELASVNYFEDAARLSKLRTFIEQELTSNGMGYVNGSIRNRLPNTTSITFPGISAGRLMTMLPGIAIATGSACTSSIPEPSHVLTAMGLSPDDSMSTIRISVGKTNTGEEIQLASGLITEAVNKLKTGIHTSATS